MVNNRFVLESIDSEQASHPPIHRQRHSYDPCLPARLPTSGFLHREADGIALKTFTEWSTNKPLPCSPRDALLDALNSDLPEPEFELEAAPRSPPSSIRSRKTSFGDWVQTISKAKSFKPPRAWHEPQAFEILGAIDKKDVMFLMQVRDKAFDMLLRKTPNGTTPLLYAMQQGKSHQEVVIILVGAFSRFVNQLDDADFAKPSTKELLKALRGNLKLAIDYGLQSAQSDLISSFMQTLIMSEGEKWLHEQVTNTTMALRAGNAVHPVDSTRSAVRSFATKQLRSLGNGQSIASLEDYVANATGDLLMMGLWSIVRTFIDKEVTIPVWYFARDDRVFKAFTDNVEHHKDRIQMRGSKRLKWQLRVLMEKMEGRTTSWRSKIESLEQVLDYGPGV